MMTVSPPAMTQAIVAVALRRPEVAIVIEGAVLVGAGAGVGDVGFAVALALRLVRRVAGASVGADVPGCSGAGCERAAATTIEVVADCVCMGEPLSLTVAVKLKVPLVVGVPEMMPVVAARVSPAGKAAGGDRPGVSRRAAGCGQGGGIRRSNCA